MTAVTWVAGEAVAPLAAFHAAAVLSTADLHAAATLCRLVGEASPDVQLAAALAVRAPGAGHVCLDLATVAQTAAGEGDPALDPGSLPWPDPAAWREAVAASPLVTGAPAPLVLDGDHLYLERYHRYERALLAWIGTHGAEPGADLEPVDDALLARVFPDDDQQRSAGRAVLRRRCTVITGGPGTGKTTTVGRIVGLLAEGWPGPEPPRVALAAPSGKAATRLQDAVRAQAADGRFSPEVAAWLAQTNAQTAHRLLRWRGGTRYGFGPERPLPVDALVLDEASMVSIALVVRLLEALPAHARVVLVGDHEQLASVEAGAVLGDLVAAARAGAPSLRDAVVTLDRVHRFRGGIAALAGALRAGEAIEAPAVFFFFFSPLPRLAQLRIAGTVVDPLHVQGILEERPEDRSVGDVVEGAQGRVAVEVEVRLAMDQRLPADHLVDRTDRRGARHRDRFCPAFSQPRDGAEQRGLIAVRDPDHLQLRELLRPPRVRQRQGAPAQGNRRPRCGRQRDGLLRELDARAETDQVVWSGAHAPSSADVAERSSRREPELSSLPVTWWCCPLGRCLDRAAGKPGSRPRPGW